jgi:hypothetical protein
MAALANQVVPAAPAEKAVTGPKASSSENRAVPVETAGPVGKEAAEEMG